jgi:hypothetical protein
MVSARSVSSLPGPGIASRRSRSCSEISRVVVVMACSGRRMRPATSQPRMIDTTVITPTATASKTRMCCGWVICTLSASALIWYSSCWIRAWAWASGDCCALGPGGVAVAGTTEEPDSCHW